MSRIVADLLLLARSSGGLQLRETEVKLDKLIADTLKSIPESQGVIDIEVEPRSCRLSRRRPTPAGRGQPGRQRRQVRRRPGPGYRFVRGPDLVIEVHDNGEGVPRKYELAIWEQFERGVHRLNSTVPGSGIGLAIVDMVVRRHGGIGRATNDPSALGSLLQDHPAGKGANRGAIRCRRVPASRWPASDWAAV